MIIDIFYNGQILESVSGSASKAAAAIENINNAKNFGAVKKYLESLDPNNGKADAEAKAAYGLRVRGQVARKKLNDAAKEIIGRVKGDHTKLTAEDKDILMQYSGRGGLKDSDGSDKGAQLFEYYTPPEIAEGAWDALKANGFENGAVCEPSVGAGVFMGTSPDGVKMVGAEIDSTSSSVATLLNPDDIVRNQSFEQLCMTIEDDSFDAMIGNVPFGDTRGSYRFQDSAYQDINQIQRYFVTRAIDKVKPNGLICLIVPVDIVSDKSKMYQNWRRLISLKAEFLGAHKLPSGTFGGANGNGTDVVTDVLVMRKHSKDLSSKVVDMLASDLTEANVYWPTWIEGGWFKSAEGKKFIHGEVTKGFRGDVVKSNLTNAGVKALLARRFNSRINLELIGVAPTIDRGYIDGDRRMIAGIEHEMMAGSWVIVEQVATVDGQIDSELYGLGTVSELEDALKGSASALSLSFEQAERAANGQYSTSTGRSVRLALYQAKQAPADSKERIYRASLIGAEIEHYSVRLAEGEATEAELEALQALIANEVSLYGNPANDLAKQVFVGDGAARVISFSRSVNPDGSFNQLLAGSLNLASDEVYNSDDLYDTIRFLTNINGLPVDIEAIREYYTGKAPTKTLSDFAGLQGIAITDDGLINTMPRYLAGNISQKISKLVQAIASNRYAGPVNDQFDLQLSIIDKTRKKTSIDGITFGFRSKWFERSYILEFLEDAGYSGGLYLDSSGENFNYESATGIEKQIGKFINGEGVSAGVKTKEYKERIAALEQQFDTWIKQHEDVEALTDNYNEIFNSFLPYEYDEAPLGLMGVSAQVKPHGYQNAAIRRASEEGRGIIALDTGLGKTFSALALAAYNQQKNRAKRTCIVVPKSVLENWYHEANQFHGKLDHALVVGFTAKKDKGGQIEREAVLDERGQPKLNRHTGEIEYRDVLIEDNALEILDKMHQIPSTAKSLIIMSKEQFGMIPMRPESRERYTDEMVQRRLLPNTKAQNFLFDGAPPKSSSYEEAKQSERLRAMYADEGTDKKGGYPYYEQMGFDSVIVDEAHEFKNAYEAGTQVSKLAYLPTAPASKRSIDMAAKMDYLRQKNAGRGPVLLSATPITNSPTEIFNMLSYVMDIQEFESMGIQSVDDFVALYCDVQITEVAKLSGDTETKEAVVGFRNLDGLRSLFNRFTNVKTAEDVNDQNNSLNIPDANEVVVSASMSNDQKEIYEDLRLLAEGKRRDEDGLIETIPRDERPAIFSIIRDMDRVTTDLDLYNRTMTFKFPIAAKQSVLQLIDDLPESTNERLGDANDGDEIEVVTSIKSDITYAENEKSYVVVAPEAYEKEIVKRFKKFNIEEKSVSHPVTPKYAEMLEKLRLEYERGGKQIVFTEEKSQHDKLKRLIVHNLPITEDQIAIINGSTATGDKLEKISASYNTGKVKIVVANKKAEVGVNLQKGTTAIHHLTFPWTPASIQQRNGRGVRQGNTVDSVDVYYYAGKGSFDTYRLDMLKRKASWLSSLFTGDETRVDNADAGDEDEYAALLASDPEDFKRRMNEQREQKAAKERAERNVRAGIALSNLATAKHVLAGLEQREQKALDEATTDEEKEAVSLRFSKLKEKNEKRITNLTRDLVDQAKSNLIDIDAVKLVEQGNYLIGSNGTAYEENSYYQGSIKGGGKVIYCIEKVNVKEGLLGGSIVNIDSYDPFQRLLVENALPVSKAPLNSIRIKMDRIELAKQNLLSARSGSIYYHNLLESKYSCGAEVLAEIQDDIAFAGDSLYLTVNSDGGYEMAKGWDLSSKKIVYPDLNNQSFVDAFCNAMLPIILGDASYQDRRTAENILGADWDNKIRNYANKADQATIDKLAVDEIAKPALAKALDGVDGALEDQTLEKLESLIYPLNMLYRTVAREALQKAASLKYANSRDISLAAEAFILKAVSEIKELISAKRAIITDIEEREYQAKLAALPKIPQEMIDILKDEGITIKINDDMVRWSDRNRGMNQKSAMGERIFLFDVNGRSGKLNAMAQKFLKKKYKAVWSADFSPGYSGLWWHFPMNGLDLSTLLEEIKKEL